MANLTPSSSFDDVYQFEVTDIIQGGPGGTDNIPHQQLLNRTQYLNQNKVNKAGDTISGLLTIVRAAATALAIRSGAAGSFAQATMGRTADELFFGVAGAANEFFAGSAAGDSAIRSVGKLLLGGSGASATTQCVTITTNGIGVFGNPNYALDIGQRAGVDNAVAIRGSAGRRATLTIAGNNNAPETTSFDLSQDNSGNANINQRAAANLYLSVNGSQAAVVDTSQRWFFPQVIGIPPGASNFLGGLQGVGSPTDYFIYDADKRIHNYGLQWIPFSYSTSGATAALSGYSGIHFFTQGILTGSINQDQRWVIGANRASLNSAWLTVRNTASGPTAWFDGPTGTSYVGMSHSGGASVLGYLGQALSLFSGGSSADFALRAENALTFGLGGTQFGYLNSSGWVFHANGAANSGIVRAISGASGSYAGLQVGRASNEVTLGVAALPNHFFTGTAAADVAIRTEGGSLWLGTPVSASVNVVTSNALRLAADGAGGLWVRPDAAGGFDTNLADLKTRSHGTTGYQKLPGGLIMQWGHQNGDGAVTFPIAFPNACFTVIPGSRGSGSGTGGEGTPRAVAGTVTRFGFTGSSSTWAGLPYDWVAFGN